MTVIYHWSPRYVYDDSLFIVDTRLKRDRWSLTTVVTSRLTGVRLWAVITLQTLWWNVGAESRSWNKRVLGCWRKFPLETMFRPHSRSLDTWTRATWMLSSIDRCTSQWQQWLHLFRLAAIYVYYSLFRVPTAGQVHRSRLSYDA